MTHKLELVKGFAKSKNVLPEDIFYHKNKEKISL